MQDGSAKPPRPGPAGTQDGDTGRGLVPAARRALAEAEARRAERDRRQAERPPEQGGRGGLDPVRYDDWEIGGRAVDF